MTSLDDLRYRFVDRDHWRDLVYPPVAEMWGHAAQLAALEGCEVYAVCGTRLYSEQTTDYLKGRHTPGPNVTAEKPMGDTVTGAQAGESGHNFGICIDGSRDKDLGRRGLQPDEDATHYEPWGRAAKRVGLDTGFYWTGRKGDAGHVGLNLASRGLNLRLLRIVFERRGLTDQRGGLADVFHYLDGFGPWTAQ